MAASYLIDTNIILRFLLKDNTTLFNRANQIFKDAENGTYKLVIDSVVLAECIWVMASVYNISKVDITDKLRQIISQSWIVSPTKKAIIQSLDLYSHTNLSYIDCWLIIQTQIQAIQLKTFDLKLQKISQKLT